MELEGPKGGRVTGGGLTIVGGGGADVVDNQGDWGTRVHGWVMAVHKSLMSNVS